jgi:hypothetical protein
MDHIGVLSTLYGATGMALVVSYAPQIWTVWRSRTGAEDVSVLTWAFWSVTAAIGLLYAKFVARDAGFVMMSLANVLGCSSVTGLAMLKRLRWKRDRASSERS